MRQTNYAKLCQYIRKKILLEEQKFLLNHIHIHLENHIHFRIHEILLLSKNTTNLLKEIGNYFSKLSLIRKQYYVSLTINAKN